VALQKYRAAFDLMRLRDKSRSCSGWTDDDTPTRNKPTAFKDSRSAAGNTENEAYVQKHVFLMFGRLENISVQLTNANIFIHV
jgi:hypothetical protein